MPPTEDKASSREQQEEENVTVPTVTRSLTDFFLGSVKTKGEEWLAPRKEN